MTVDAPAYPYVGLRAFSQHDSELFFGRDRESRRLATLWQANRLTVLFGPSGIGKTSLLHAGVLPRIADTGADVWPVGRMSPTVAEGMGNPFRAALLSSWAPSVEPAPGDTLRAFAQAHPERIDPYGDPVPTMIALDQAEELFSNSAQLAREREEFIEELAQLLHDRPSLHLLLSIREDHLAAVLPHEDVLGRDARARFQLKPFDRAAAMEAVRRPLEGTFRRYAEGAAETLVDDLRTVGIRDARGAVRTVLADTVEPVQLQVVCAALWESLPDSVEKITSIHVRELADVDRFLSRFCNRALAAVAAEHERSAAEIRTWLRRAFITELGTRGTAYEGLDDTAGMPNAVVRALEDQHILRAEHRSGSRWYELQHDRLIPPIRQASPKEYLQSAREALAGGDLREAERQARQVLETTSEDLRIQAEAESLLGEVAVREDDFAAAQSCYRKAAGLFEVLGDTAAVGHTLARAGQMSLRGGQPEAAIAELTAAVNRIPTELWVRTDLALALWHAGRPEAAVIVLDSALAIAPDTTDALQIRGETFHPGFRGDARLNALRIRGEILADQGAAVEALRDLARVRRRQGTSTLAARALALAHIGEQGAAEQEAEDALANVADEGPVLLRIAQVKALGGDERIAAQLAERALAAMAPRLPRHLRAAAMELAAER